MKQLILSAALAVAMAFGASAESLSPEQALARAAQSQPARVAAKGMMNPQLVKTVEANGLNTVYVFTTDNSTLLLSADDCAQPVLGYLEDVSNMENMPPNLSWWLSEYSRQIAWGSKRGIVSKESRSDIKEPIEPLCPTPWGQDYPYNLLCPEIDGELCCTGCSATALAMVLNYFKWPESPNGTVQYGWFQGGGSIEKDLDDIVFDWDNIIDVYDDDATDEQMQAVATLMMACGYALQSDFGVEYTEAFEQLFPQRIYEHFSIAPSINRELRASLTDDQWDTLIYDNLKNCGPILYTGALGTADSHAFVCDGYQDGYYHFNWGWNGNFDGYFLLSALQPDIEEQYNGYNGISFNYDQSALVGFVPDDREMEPAIPYLAAYLPLAYSVDEEEPAVLDISNGVWSQSNRTAYYEIALRVEDMEGVVETEYLPVYWDEDDETYEFEIEPTGGLQHLYFNFSSLRPGQYKAYPVYRVFGQSGDEWIDVREPLISDPYISVDWDGSEIAINSWGSVQYGEYSVAPLVAGQKSAVSIVATNESCIDRTASVGVVLMAEKTDYWIACEPVAQTYFHDVVLVPGESYTFEWELYIPQALTPGTYYLSFLIGGPSPEEIECVEVEVKSTSGITSILTEAADEGPIFDLVGRQVSNPAPGLYIQNGKKIIIK